MKYATFWQRFVAGCVDALIFIPLGLFNAFVLPASKALSAAEMIVISIIGCAYVIYGHGRYGQTVGKYAMGIRVVRTNGDRIGWREAWLRSSIDIVFTVLSIIASITALTTIPDADFYGVDWFKRAENLQAHEPKWLAWMPIAIQVWVWSEVVVMLFNKRRRALHDFIAGTIVIAEPTVAASQESESPMPE